jgi:hypothetical protein
MKHRSHRRRTSQVAASEMTGVEQRDDESPWVRRAVRIAGRPDIRLQKGLIPGSSTPRPVAPPITFEEPLRCMTKVTATSFVTATTMRCDENEDGGSDDERVGTKAIPSSERISSGSCDAVKNPDRVEAVLGAVLGCDSFGKPKRLVATPSTAHAG